ncbi:gliding motility protein GldB-related protein [Fibrella aquatilis]|uniref:DUF2268 domain-containing protein n=1 Tax=Fibrella aquatilis TaxID=2817059 RepID=A0A939G4Q8_9BACT|nr:DUF2268 domain-containing putative Zn-dependent protease [Fibrella aquatilis]MBO0931040.1 hypothetical protein [Fibrella aquatilis]
MKARQLANTVLSVSLLFSCERLLIPAGEVTVFEGRVADPDQLLISTRDVDLFWEAYDMAPQATDQTAHWQRNYIDKASPTVQSTLSSGKITAAIMAKATISTYRQFFPSVRTLTTGMVRQQEGAIRQGLRTLKQLYPDATFPAIYFGMGLFNNGGKSLPSGIYIGTEYYTAAPTTITTELTAYSRGILFNSSQLPAIVAHEMVHQQQRYGIAGGNTLLAAAIAEGSADFLAKLATGAIATGTATYTFGEANERAVWQAFSQEMDGTNWRNWLYNGNAGNTYNYPADMGYFVGYRICEAYYNRATNKTQALRDMLQTTDYKAFLTKSGYPELWK